MKEGKAVVHQEATYREDQLKKILPNGELIFDMKDKFNEYKHLLLQAHQAKQAYLEMGERLNVSLRKRIIDFCVFSPEEEAR